jgi:hypothetical protein
VIDLFHVVEDATVILRNKKGVYRQAKVYHRGGRLYAGLGSGFVRLMQRGTSNPDVSWEDLSEDGGFIVYDRVHGPVWRTVKGIAA